MGGAKILNTNSRVQLLIIIMSRKTRNTKVEAAEESPEDIVLDSEEEEEDIKEEIKGEIFVPTRTQTQCVVIAPDSLWKNGKFTIVKLRNPRTLHESLYAFTHQDSELYELNQFAEDKRSVATVYLHTYNIILYVYF